MLDPNFFDCLDLPATPALNREQLEQNYLDKARQWHPDRFVSAPKPEQSRAQQMAARVNEAYRVLRCPVKRAEYLVKLGGIDLDSSEPERGAPAPSPAFLMEMLERRDAIESGEIEAEDALDQVESELDQTLAAATRALGEKKVREAADLLVRYRYFRRLADELDQA